VTSEVVLLLLLLLLLFCALSTYNFYFFFNLFTHQCPAAEGTVASNVFALQLQTSGNRQSKATAAA
jgi:flagellar basal body-associated protein FliL